MSDSLRRKPMSDSLMQTPLGRQVVYPSTYSSELLFPIDRQTNRASLDLPQTWYGQDIWNAYEVSWLDLRGKPVVGLARFGFAHDTPNLVESKSLKLYLNSFNQTSIATPQEVSTRMQTDLSAAAGGSAEVELRLVRDCRTVQCRPMEGDCIDDIDVAIASYAPQPGLLRCLPGQDTVSETLVSDLLKSNCPVTGQPDWGSVQVRYTGRAIDRASLLAYIVSMRQHTEFHEHCVEKMFCDIWHACQPAELLVYARYTRRGGLDINPWRSSHPATVSNVRTPRQ